MEGDYAREGGEQNASCVGRGWPDRGEGGEGRTAGNIDRKLIEEI